MWDGRRLFKRMTELYSHGITHKYEIQVGFYRRPKVKETGSFVNLCWFELSWAFSSVSAVVMTIGVVEDRGSVAMKTITDPWGNRYSIAATKHTRLYREPQWLPEKEVQP